MKTLLFTFAFCTFISTSLFAQVPTVSSYVERTKMGTKFGNQIGVRFQNNFQLGGFYQKDISHDASTEKIPAHLVYEKEFYGMYMTAPLCNQNVLGLDMTVRTGVTNGQNFTITPSLLGSYKPTKLLAFNAGLGIRAFRPTVMAGLTLNIGSL